jgi:catechol 2,3-dioxygenase-like lactoylglutathione lyase family enzyme
MSRITLEHYNLMTARLRETVAFYTDVLGLYEGFYPAELGPGAWMYDSTDTPVVHMQEVIAENFEAVAGKTRNRLGDLRAPLELDKLYGTATLDHIAFSCEDIEGFKAKLDRLGVPYRETGVASAAVRQLFLRDPNGVILELNFRQ